MNYLLTSSPILSKVKEVKHLLLHYHVVTEFKSEQQKIAVASDRIFQL